MSKREIGTGSPLKALYRTTTETVHVHAGTCPMLKTASRGVRLLTIEEAIDARDEQGFKLIYCKCCK